MTWRDDGVQSRMTKIVLVRHGHVEGIEPKRFRGRADLPLTERGHAQAQAVAQRIASLWRPAAIYTSPLQRCIATGAAIGQACSLEPRILDDLNDIDYGAWQFKSYDEIEAAHPELFAAWLATPHLVRFPDGESLQDLVARSADALRFVLETHAADTVVLVAHDSTNRALLLQLLNQPLSAYWRLAQDPCCINEIDIADGNIRILRINDTAHLSTVS
jgi:phosphoserine phosphatase